MPQFAGSSYVKYALPAGQSVLDSLAIVLEFRAQGPDGLLLYGSQANILGDFYALSLNNIRLELEYNLGESVWEPLRPAWHTGWCLHQLVAKLGKSVASYM